MPDGLQAALAVLIAALAGGLVVPPILNAIHTTATSTWDPNIATLYTDVLPAFIVAFCLFFVVAWVVTAT